MSYEGALNLSHFEPHADRPHDPLSELDDVATSLVGCSGVEGAIQRLRRAMLCEALARTGGNYTKAASLLGVQRQAIQNMVTRYGLRQWAAAARLTHTITRG